MANMQTLRLGEMSLVAHSSGIRFIWHHDGDHGVTVPTHKIAALKAFLDEHHADERRLGFRVPLRPLSGAIRDAFAVTLESENGKRTAVPVDLSLTGILVDVVDVKLRVSQSVRIALSLGEDSVTLTAVVVRSNKQLVALHFPSCVQDGELDPPEELLAIYRALELRWLKSRKL